MLIRDGAYGKNEKDQPGSACRFRAGVMKFLFRTQGTATKLSETIITAQNIKRWYKEDSKYRQMKVGIAKHEED